jgi:hypothetical protein
VAAALRSDPGVEVRLVEGHYGEFTVLVGAEEVVSGGAFAFAGVLPSIRTVRERVAQKLGATGPGASS